MKRLVLPFVTAGLAALVLPWSSASAGEQPAFSGYNSSAWAAPVKVEIYEPTIPIPASPQFDFEMGYTRVEAETGLARGRGSWLWPGDPVGEGLKTFVEQLGLPKELGERGYPVQVNSTYPTGPEKQQDEPFPGSIMQTSAGEDQVVAQVGFSPDGKAQEPGGDGEGGDGGGAPGLPEVPGVPTDALEEFGDAITGSGTGSSTVSEPEPDPGGTPGMPEELAALVDFTGYTSTSQADTGTDVVTTVSRSTVSDVALLGGVVTIEGVRTKMVTASDGAQATAKGSSDIGAMTIAGTRFRIGPDGIEAAGQKAPIPGLPDDPAKALAELGLKLTLPKPQLDRDGDASSGLVQGLRVEIDSSKLRRHFDALPIGDLIGAIPDEAKELKNLVSAAAGLSPRFVITLGNSGTATDTVQGIVVPDIPIDPAAGAGGDTAGGATGGGGGGVPTVGAPGAPADSGSAPTADGDLTGAEPMGSGLPPLNSVPGALTVGGIALATAAGTWLRKIGLVALGGTGSCPHGLDSGLPDLRKA